MHEVRALPDRFAPIVVDHECRAVHGAACERLRNCSGDIVLRGVLDAKLNKLCASTSEASDPSRRRYDGIERIEDAPGPVGASVQDTRSILKKGVPATGVEGEPMSRGAIKPASKPRRPASTARAKAEAM